MFLGTTMSGKPVQLLAYQDYEAGERQIKLLYATSDVLSEYQFCQVGANNEPVLHGCLLANGTISLDGIKSVDLSYSYNPDTDNQNGRTLAGFSTKAETLMANCGPSCPHADYSKYYNYFGVHDYGHQYITAALEQRQTAFVHGNVDFSTYSMPALEKTIQIATVNLNVWMYIIYEFEDALNDCAKGCASDECKSDQVNAWDEGVAFYAGSLEGADGSGDGVLSYALADELCVDFQTCGVDGTADSGHAFANHEIIRLSEPAVDLLMNDMCAETRVYMEEIVDHMTSVLVQALLRSTYDTSTSRTEELDATAKNVARGEAAAYAAAVLPILHNCSASDAAVVYEQLEYDNKDQDRDYVAIKSILENHYECMGITCEQVGGLWDPTTQTYRKDASPCASSPQDSDDKQVAIIGGCMLVGGAALVVLAALLIAVRQRRNSSKEVQQKKEVENGKRG